MSEISLKEKKKNRKKRERRQGARRFLKFIGILVLIAFVVFIVFLVATYGFHTKATREEEQMLTKAQLFNDVTLDDGRVMNAASYGDPESDHVIVPISDVAVCDMSVYVRHMMKDADDFFHVAFVDRAGYGFSDDSNNKQTVEQIVEDYRQTLKKANVSAPYILMAHDFGSVYATYWAHAYPDEVSGIVHVNGIEITDKTKINNYQITKQDKFDSILFKIGFQRTDYYDLHGYTPWMLSTEEGEMVRALNNKSVRTKAQLSELSLMKDNFEKAKSIVSDVAVPQLYISSINSFQTEKEVKEYFKYKNKQNESLNQKAFYDLEQDEEIVSENIKTFLSDCAEKYQANTIPYVESLQNCQLTRIPGDEKIYEQNAVGVANAVFDFVLYINGYEDAIEEKYVDQRVLDWERFREEYGVTIQQQEKNMKK